MIPSYWLDYETVKTDKEEVPVKKKITVKKKQTEDAAIEQSNKLF